MGSPTTTLAAIFHAPGQPLELVELPLPTAIPAGGALCRVLLATICGSDLHTIAGRRREPAPLVLGHEIVGEIVALGDGLETDGFGDPLAVGDRVSWTIAASCGACRNCRRGFPQKCESLRKYGHSCVHDDYPLSGGYAQHVQLWPGTTVFRIPDSVPTAAAAPANCALATAVHALEASALANGEGVLVLGAGLFGLCVAALASERGASPVIIADVRDDRLDMARRFGATHTINMATTPSEDAAEVVSQITGGTGPQVVIEVCGQPQIASWAIGTMDIGGRMVVAGMVMPGTVFEVEGNQLARRCLTVRGIHNYAPRHLAEAIRFLERREHGELLASAVGPSFPLKAVNEAVNEARQGESLRVAILPA